MSKEFYESNYTSYINQTLDIDFKIDSRIFKYLSCDSKILEVGSGSGRDALKFKNLGYNVVGSDIVEGFISHLCKLNLDSVYFDVTKSKLNQKFNLIYCSASLLHLNDRELKMAFKNISDHLENYGFVYASFKLGDAYRTDELDRYFNDQNGIKILNYLDNSDLKKVEEFITHEEVRNQDWYNVILKKGLYE